MLGRDAVGQLDVGEPLERLLAREVAVGAVGLKVSRTSDSP